MKKLLSVFVVGLLMFGVVGMANATVLTFDDIDMSSGGGDFRINTLDSTYGGFTWDSRSAVGNLQFPTYENASYSGTQYLVNQLKADNILITNGNLFDFDGAWFQTPTASNEPSNWINITAYDSLNNVIGTTGNIGVSETSLWVSAGFKNVSSLNIERDSGFYTMDDFTYTGASPLPEPATMLLFGSGLVGAFIRRRRTA